MNKELKADMIAAKLLGQDHAYISGDRSNPYDILKTVIAIGERHGVSFSYSINEVTGKRGWWWMACGVNINHFSDEEWFDTYQEAVQAALLSLAEYYMEEV